MMMVRVVTDFEMIFTGDLSKFLGKIMILFKSFNTSKKIDYGPLKNIG